MSTVLVSQKKVHALSMISSQFLLLLNRACESLETDAIESDSSTLNDLRFACHCLPGYTLKAMKCQPVESS